MLTSPQRLLTLAAGLGSAALLAGAFAFQYLGGLLPCQLCLWQRWPHGVAVAVMLLALATGWRWLLWLGALAALTTAGIGLFHAGVEQGWWPGLASCSVNTLSGVGVADLLDPTKNVAQPVRCDAIPWQMAGISMAGWNAIASAVLALLWLSAARRRAA